MSAAKLISTRDLIVVSADGKLDLPATETALVQLIAELEREPGRSVVFDLRKAKCDFSLAEVYGLVNFLATHSSQKTLYRRIAVLISATIHQPKASFFTLCAENRGLEAKAFTALKDVCNWLGNDAAGLLGSD